MKILIYNSCAITNPAFGLLINEAINLIKQGKDVVFCHCRGAMNICADNPLGKTTICSLCKMTFKKTINKYLPNISIVHLDNHRLEKIFFNFSTIEELKNIKYKDVGIGYSVYAYYATKARNSKPILSSTFVDCINILLNEAASLTDSFENVIKNNEITKVVLFNGRFFENRAILDLAKFHNISYDILEVVNGIRTVSNYNMLRFSNTTPHNLKTIHENIFKSWNKSPLSEEEKIKIGRSFYEKRRNGIIAGDRVYVSNQIKNLLPSDYSEEKINIVIYNSSDDEMSSVSRELDEKKIFASQYDGIEQIVRVFQNDGRYHFYLRIHPNLNGLPIPIDQLSEYKNLTIIFPDSPISTYALLDIASQVIVFGSTIGIESIYWGKPVILLFAADYYYFNACSIPINLDEIIDAIHNPHYITDEDKMNAIKYGMYILNNNNYEETLWIDISPKYYKFVGINLFVFNYLKVFNSSLLYKMYQFFITSIRSRLDKAMINYPDKLIQ